MGGVNRLSNERYDCPQCTQSFTDNEVRDTWKCPDCGGHIHVYAEDEETDTRIVLIRKRACEVEPGDLVHLPGMLAQSPYRVLGVSKLGGGKLGIGLKGYTQYKLGPNEPVNCRIGSW